MGAEAFFFLQTNPTGNNVVLEYEYLNVTLTIMSSEKSSN